MSEESTPDTETTTPAIVTPPLPTPQPAPPRDRKPGSDPYSWGTGRRKSAVARVRIRPGEGKFIINKRELDKFFLIDKDRLAVRVPLEVTDTVKSMDVFVNVKGGGISGQAGAVLLGLARALAKHDPSFAPKLKENQLMTRDPRRVERKKYGQRGARRRFQFSKR